MRHLRLFGNEAAFGKFKLTLANMLHKKCLLWEYFMSKSPL